MKGLARAGIALLLILNTYAGVARITAFWHRHRAEAELARADLNKALADLRAAARWRPGDAPNWLLMGKVVEHAQANGLPLDAMEGRSSLEVFAFGLAAVARGVALNPADAWGWFNVATLHEAARSASERLERMRRAGEAALTGAQTPDPPPRPAGALDPIDRIALAASFKAQQLEPDFHFYPEFRASLYWKRGMHGPAAAEIRRSVSLTPSLWAHKLLENKPFASAMEGAVMEGLVLAESNPFLDRAQVLEARAGFLYMMGRLEEAIPVYEDLRSLVGRVERQEADVEMARARLALGQVREALVHLERALQAGEDGPQGRRALLHSAEARSRLGEHETAATLLRRLLALSPRTFAAYEALARELDHLGQSQEAEKVLVGAVRAFPELPSAYHNVIAHMRANGRAAAAIPYAQGLARVAPDPEDGLRLLREVEKEAAGRPSP
ncbi:MAG TPA: tetratricopeptide repeat protein [Candidatus Polarisedimenticolia bacterium]|nr:tetratricopeptide repeat protein [Candidatus Polarisedimenticolia bacterium]